MPVYQFKDKATGEPRERFFSMSEVPGIGAEIAVDGETWVRQVSRVGGIQNKMVGHVSTTVPRWCKHAPSHDRMGRAVCKNEREMRTMVDKINNDSSIPGEYQWGE
jgi:hypothetical protein